MKTKEVEKNLLDLKHSVSLAKAGTFLALAIGSWPALFFGVREFYSDAKLAILIASGVAIILTSLAVRYFKNCEDIHNKVESITR